MVHLSNILVQLSDQVVQLPAFHAFGKSQFKEPKSDTRIFGLITKMQGATFFCFEFFTTLPKTGSKNGLNTRFLR